MTGTCAHIVEFSTDFLPEEDRIAYWREHYGHLMLRVDLEPAKDVAFHACMTSLSLPGLQLIEGTSSPARISRTGAYLADGNDDALLAINRSGIASVRSGGREQILHDGEAILLMGNEPTSFCRTTPGHSYTVRYAGWLLRVGTTLEPDLANLSVRHVQDLLALTLGPANDFKEVARTRGLRAARLKQAKTHIIEHSQRREISVGSVAAHLCVTPRYLQRLFEEDGTTFSEFLVLQRLAQAHRRLCEPDSVHAAISTIAYDVGFGDLSYFNRRFRRLYGLTPREVRGEGN
jgi:AraC-like DNA-binding protein